MDVVVRREPLGNFYPLNPPRSKDEESVVRSAVVGGRELARRNPASHTAGFDEFIHAADMVRNLRGMSAAASRTEFKEHRTLFGVAKFDVSNSLSQSKSVHCAVAHIGYSSSLCGCQLGRVLDTDIHAIGRQ